MYYSSTRRRGMFFLFPLPNGERGRIIGSSVGCARRARPEGGVSFGKTRIFWLAAGLYPGQRGLRHRHWQRVALPHPVRRERRRRVRAVLPAVFDRHGHPDFDDGAGCGPRRARQRGRSVPRAGAQGFQVALARLGLPGRVLPADDVLHHRQRLDDGLLLQIHHRRV